MASSSSSSLVFKVKYEDTLRRFNVAVDGNRRLDLRRFKYEDLRLKIRSLFNLPSDKEFRLTYEDEDDDLVTLVDDNDLNDVVTQGLDPVRITVHLNSDKSGQSSSASFSASSALNTPFAQNVQPIVSPDAAKVLKLNIKPLTLNYEQNADSNCKKHEGSQNGNSYKRTIDSGISLSLKSPLCESVSSSNSKNPSSESSSNKVSSSEGMKKSNDVSCELKSVTTMAEYLRATEDAAAKNRGTSYDTIPPSECPFSGISLTFDQSLKQTSSSSRSSSTAADSGSKVHDVICDGCDAYPIVGTRFISKVKYDYDLCSSCFSKMGNDKDYTRTEIPVQRFFLFKAPTDAECRSFVNKGIRCDGCGVLPIIGARFKSLVKTDYDLCHKCFTFTANYCDYYGVGLSTLPMHLRAGQPKPLLKPRRAKLDSLFVMDVTITDGTTMAPSTPFTKVWRMRNMGVNPWKHGFQLRWIGGDRFTPSDSIQLQIPYMGVAYGTLLEIAADFTAPELPGKYISFWRMADSSGHEFGHRVWVKIQVDPSVDLTRESSPTLNLNLPPNTETAFPEVVVKAEAGLDKVGESSAESIVDQNHNTETVGLNLPNSSESLNADYLARATADRSVAPVGPSSGSDPKVDAYSGESSFASTNMEGKSVTFDEKNLVQERENNQEFLMENDLKLMESEVLSAKELDLDVSEWDPILEELKEMGFEDKDANKKLLEKNNGSISRVVMDLIAEEKA